jgi:hypothetical protein
MSMLIRFFFQIADPTDSFRYVGYSRIAAEVLFRVTRLGEFSPIG